MGINTIEFLNLKKDIDYSLTKESINNTKIKEFIMKRKAIITIEFDITISIYYLTHQTL